jgi:hypothetical protein
MNLRIAGGKYFYRLTHALIFGRLSARVRGTLDRRGIVQADRVFGLLQHGRVTEKYLLRLLKELRPGTYELYCHPNTEDSSVEVEALCSPKVKQLIADRGIELVRYQDLAGRP